jgi:hypothetical protein
MTHASIDGLCLCNRGIKKGLSTNLELVTCEKCIYKLKIEFSFISQNEYQRIYNKKLKNSYAQAKTPFTPEPNVHFEIGEKIVWGANVNPEIVGILEDGKYYIVKSTTNNVAVVAWYTIYKLDDCGTRFRTNEHLWINFSNMSVSSIISKYLYFGVDMCPSYQRDYKWSDEQNEALIDSLFKNIEIGKFVFVQLPWKHESYGYEVLDGK